MNSQNQKMIQRARIAMHQAKKENAIAKKRQQQDLERMSATLQLLADDLRAEGIDPTTPYGQAIFWQVVGEKLAAIANQATDSDPGGMPDLP